MLHGKPKAQTMATQRTGIVPSLTGGEPALAWFWGGIVEEIARSGWLGWIRRDGIRFRGFQSDVMVVGQGESGADLIAMPDDDLGITRCIGPTRCTPRTCRHGPNSDRIQVPDDHRRFDVREQVGKNDRAVWIRIGRHL